MMFNGQVYLHIQEINLVWYEYIHFQISVTIVTHKHTVCTDSHALSQLCEIMPSQAHTHTHTYIHTYRHTYIYTHTHTHTHGPTYIYTYTHTHTHIHTYKHTHVH